MKEYIISIDPATGTGIAIYWADGETKGGITATIKRGKKQSFAEHIKAIDYFIGKNHELIYCGDSKFNKAKILIEAGVYIGFRNKKHAAILDEYRGALTYILDFYTDDSIYRIHPDEWKKSLGLKRNAGKDEIKYLYDSVCSTFRGQDEIDAMGMIYHELYGRPHDLDIKEFFNIFEAKK